MVKNCGGLIHKEIAHKDMIESLKELIKVNKNKKNFLFLIIFSESSRSNS
jgi:hypothetical protein